MAQTHHEQAGGQLANVQGNVEVDAFCADVPLPQHLQHIFDL